MEENNGLRFIISYLVMFVCCLVPMALFGSGTVSVFLCAAMNAGYAVGTGKVSLLWNAPLTFLAVSFLTKSVQTGTAFTLTVTISVFVAALLYEKRIAFGEKMCAVSAAFFVPFALYEIADIRTQGTSFHQIAQASNETALSMMESMGVFSEADLALLKEALSSVQPYVEGLFPAVFLILSIVGAYLILSGMKKVLKGLDERDNAGIPEFSELHFGYGLFILLVLSVIGMIAAPMESVRVYMWDAFLVLVFLAAACGLSLVEHYFKKAIRFGMFRTIIYVAAVYFIGALALLGLALCGIIDGFARFRKIEKTKKNEGGNKE